jgi:hypothetical protein
LGGDIENLANLPRCPSSTPPHFPYRSSPIFHSTKEKKKLSYVFTYYLHPATINAHKQQQNVSNRKLLGGGRGEQTKVCFNILLMYFINAITSK